MKKVSSILITLIVVFSIAACGSNGNNENASNSNADEENTTDATNNGDSGVNFPDNPVTLIVPYSAGGGTDLVARTLASATEEYLGESIAVVNKTGGGGAVGMTEGAAAKPDGYTVTMITLALSTFPHQDLSPTSYKDFKPIAKINMDPATITVPSDAPYDTLDEFIEYAKEHPGELQVGNSGSGTQKDLATATFENAANLEFTHVPFEGAAPTIAALLGGHIDFTTVTIGEALSQIESGKLKPLAVMANKRVSQFPDVPTLKESGYDIEFGPWRGLGVPTDTPDEVVEVLQKVFMEGAGDEEFVQFMEKNSFELDVQDAKSFGQFLANDYEFYGDLLGQLESKK